MEEGCGGRRWGCGRGSGLRFQEDNGGAAVKGQQAAGRVTACTLSSQLLPSACAAVRSRPEPPCHFASRPPHPSLGSPTQKLPSPAAPPHHPQTPAPTRGRGAGRRQWRAAPCLRAGCAAGRRAGGEKGYAAAATGPVSRATHAVLPLGSRGRLSTARFQAPWPAEAATEAHPRLPAAPARPRRRARWARRRAPTRPPPTRRA